jgi:hypothetical protein
VSNTGGAASTTYTVDERSIVAGKNAVRRRRQRATAKYMRNMSVWQSLIVAVSRTHG